jgi:uncharacterized protein (DUF58 family)
MISSALIKKIKALEIKTRKIVNSTFSGEYHSIFKGQGINFAEIRNYNPGDDVRLIDWNVTAKTGDLHVKLFEEERELTVILMVDVSASSIFGSDKNIKKDISGEIAAILGFSANSNKDRVGLVLFTDEVEFYLPPKKGKDHILRILREIYYFKPKGRKTSLSKAVDFVLKTNKKKAIVFLISDFVDVNYEKQMRVCARKHDLVPIQVEDPRETHLVKSGVVALEDPETGSQIYLNSSSESVRQKFNNIVLARKLEFDRFFKSIDVSPIVLDITKPFIVPLVTYFKSRMRKIR